MLHGEFRPPRRINVVRASSSYYARSLMMHAFQEKIKKTLSASDLIQSGQCWIVGVSGGADSCALLHALHGLSEEWGIKLSVAHVNHGLRAASEEEAQFVSDLCAQWGLPCQIKKVDTQTYVEEQQLSIEMAARKVRHHFFTEQVQELAASGIFLGQHLDDQAETLILRMSRGSSSRGMGGMALVSSVHDLMIVRPMLELSHQEALDYLVSIGAAWREDASNLENDYARNRIRNKVLPELKKNNPEVTRNIARTAALIRRDHDYLEAEALSRYADLVEFSNATTDVLLVNKWKELEEPIADRVLIHWLEALGFDLQKLTQETLSTLAHFMNDVSGSGLLDLPGAFTVERSYDRLMLKSDETLEAYEYALNAPGSYEIEEAALKISLKHSQGFSKENCGSIGTLPLTGYVRSNDSKKPLTLRSWQEGDRIKPLGFKGSKKIQDIFVDQKIPRSIRKRWPVLVQGDEVLWLPGYRVAEGWEVRGGQEASIKLELSGI